MKFTNEQRSLLEKRVDNSVTIENESKSIHSIYIDGQIGQSMWSYGYTSKDMLHALRQANGKDVNVYINSGGGDVFDGIAIHNMLAQYEGKVTGIVTGLAGSSASVILMGCETIQMGANAMIMIHRASTMTYGNADTMDETAKLLRQVDKSVTTSYKHKYKGSDEELDNLLVGEHGDGTWFTAEEAIKEGFADSITDIKFVTEKEDDKPEDEPNKPDVEPDIEDNATNTISQELVNEFEQFIADKNAKEQAIKDEEQRKQSANETVKNILVGLNQFLGGK